MLFDGSRPGPGRPKGSLNRWSRSSLEAVLTVFENLGGVEAMTEWARDHRSEFYRGLFGRTLPTRADVGISLEGPRSVVEMSDAQLLAIIQAGETPSVPNGELTLTRLMHDSRD